MKILSYDIKLDKIISGYDRKTCWVHARGGTIPGATPSVVVLMQKALLTKDDCFYPLTEMRTYDMGKTWSEPKEHRKTLGRRRVTENMEICPCDFTPAWHAASGKMLATGHLGVYQKNNEQVLSKRTPCYSVYEPVERCWSSFDFVDMPDENKFYNSGAGCAQRYDLQNGQILLPIYFRSKSDNLKAGTDIWANIPLSVTVLRCAFDGQKLSYIEHGSELTIPDGRGLVEPSITCYNGRYYLTIRNDTTGYVTSGKDGITFDKPIPWCWDDGENLGNYNTQQHWVTHSDGLFLVYTRKGKDNDNVMRHRAPLFMAQVDPERLCVIRDTECILVPNRGARLGNFGVTNVNKNETWVVVAEWMQSTPPNPYDCTVCEKYGSDNTVFAARIIWREPNGEY